MNHDNSGDVSAVAAVPQIRHLAIKRFRGIRDFSWHPASGVNVILGGGDVCKTTLLDAVALLLSPTNAGTPTDIDYFERSVEDGFVVEGVMSLPADTGVNEQLKPAWPWQWNGTEAVVPSVEAEAEPGGGAVYRLRVRGTAASS